MSNEESARKEEFQTEPWLHGHGCVTGDCPHEYADQCQNGPLVADAVQRERELCDAHASLRAEVERMVEALSSAADELSGTYGLTPGDELKIESASRILDDAIKETYPTAGGEDK